MARILIEGGPLRFERTASNEKADRVLVAAALHLGFRGSTNDRQAVLDFVGGKVMEYLNLHAKGGEVQQRVQRVVADTERDAPRWGN